MWKAYTKGYPVEWLVIYTSPELFINYRNSLKALVRFTSAGPQEDSKRLLFRTAVVRPDPDLEGCKIRFLEDKFAWSRR